MSEFVVTTFDWVPETPRGFVRDLRICWALEEAELPYRVEGTSFENRRQEHFSQQPFGQVPWLTDGETSIFETGAILLYLAERSTALMPRDPAERNKVIEWLFASLNSVEMAVLPWAIMMFEQVTGDTPERKIIDDFLASRLQQMEQVLADREWLTGTFSVADIVMSDVLRLVDRFDGLEQYKASRDYVARATARPAFLKAYADQLAFFAAADVKRNA